MFVCFPIQKYLIWKHVTAWINCEYTVMKTHIYIDIDNVFVLGTETVLLSETLQLIYPFGGFLGKMTGFIL
jgi:hypothetical protein